MLNGAEIILDKTCSPHEQRRLKDATSCMLQPLKFAGPDHSLWFGLAANLRAYSSFLFTPPPLGCLMLMTVPWGHEMGDWGAQEWAWFILLALDSLSKSLPKMHTQQRAGEAACH